MEDSEAQRKIELQAPDDLAYLLTNVRRAAAARLDEAFPPVDGADAAAGEDELRTRIEKLVDDVSFFLVFFSSLLLTLECTLYKRFDFYLTQAPLTQALLCPRRLNPLTHFQLPL